MKNILFKVVQIKRGALREKMSLFEIDPRQIADALIKHQGEKGRETGELTFPKEEDPLAKALAILGFSETVPPKKHAIDVTPNYGRDGHTEILGSFKVHPGFSVDVPEPEEGWGADNGINVDPDAKDPAFEDLSKIIKKFS